MNKKLTLTLLFVLFSLSTVSAVDKNVTSLYTGWGLDANATIGDISIWIDPADLNKVYVPQADGNLWYVKMEDFNTYGDQRYISDWNGQNWYSPFFSAYDLNIGNSIFKGGTEYPIDDLNKNAYSLCDGNEALTGANDCVDLTNFHLGGGGGSTDEKVKISSNDTTADYLLNKLTAGEGIDLTEIGDGGNEDLQIDGEEASTTNKGIAEFNSGCFSVAAGVVSLAGNVLKQIDGDTGSATPNAYKIDIVGGTGISTSAAGNVATINYDGTGITGVFTGFGVDTNSNTGHITLTADLDDLNTIYLRSIDLNGQNWYSPFLSVYDLNIGNSIFKGATEYPLEDLNANAFSLCDGNQALTGANNCVDLTRFDIDTTSSCDNNTDCEYTGSLNIGAGESVTVTSPDVNYTIIKTSDLNITAKLYLDAPGSEICFSRTAGSCDVNIHAIQADGGIRIEGMGKYG